MPTRSGPGRVEWLLIAVALAGLVGLGVAGMRFFEEGARQHQWIEPFPGGATATGTVQWALPIVSSGRTLYRCQINFATQDGNFVTFLARPTVVEPAFGSKVTVSYSPTDPSAARIIGEAGVQWSTTYVLGVILVVLAAAVGLLVMTILIRWSWYPSWSEDLLRVVQAAGSAAVAATTGALLALSGDHPSSLAAFLAAGLFLLGVVAVAPGRPRTRQARRGAVAPGVGDRGDATAGPFAPGGAGWHVAAQWFAAQGAPGGDAQGGAPGGDAPSSSSPPPRTPPRPAPDPAPPGSWTSWYEVNAPDGNVRPGAPGSTPAGDDRGHDPPRRPDVAP